MQTDLRVPYRADAEQVQTVLERATRGVEGVLPDKPVEVLCYQFGDSARTMHVHWSIATCENDTQMIGQVNVALEAALSAAALQIAYNKVEVDVHHQ